MGIQVQDLVVPAINDKVSKVFLPQAIETLQLSDWEYLSIHIGKTWPSSTMSSGYYIIRTISYGTKLETHQVAEFLCSTLDMARLTLNDMGSMYLLATNQEVEELDDTPPEDDDDIN